MKRFGFVTRTLACGSGAAVLRYNILSGIWSTIFARSMMIPLLSYFDDFSPLLRAGLSEKALVVSNRFFDILGFQLNAGKSSVGNRITFLGLLGAFPSDDSKGKLLISLPDGKRAKWCHLIDSYLDDGAIPHSRLEQLTGRLFFSKTSLFGKFARTQLMPLYRKFHRRVYNAHLPLCERHVFEWRRAIIADFAPRTVVSRSSVADWVIYTDAATDPPWICSLRFNGKSRSPELDTLCSAPVPPVWLYLFRQTCLFYGLELLALVAYFEDHAPSLKNSCCWIYLGSNCLAALVRSGSNTEVVAILVARSWLLVRRRNICVRPPRVRSKLNPADLPARDKQLPYRSAFPHRMRSLNTLSRACRSHLRQ